MTEAGTQLRPVVKDQTQDRVQAKQASNHCATSEALFL
uniref:MGT-6L n=1 Tax=Mus musculus TaxID=10090 RepID=C0LNQ3_MOUSE|nr:MGT-6L [Mus musculus]